MSTSQAASACSAAAVLSVMAVFKDESFSHATPELPMLLAAGAASLAVAAICHFAQGSFKVTAAAAASGAAALAAALVQAPRHDTQAFACVVVGLVASIASAAAAAGSAQEDARSYNKFVTPAPQGQVFARPARAPVAPRAAESDPYLNYSGKVGEGFDVKKMPGVLPPVGFFDPLKLSEGKTEERMRYFREAELKHGRVAMLAAVGFLLQESFHPLFGGNIDVPSYIAFQQTPLEKFWGKVVLSISTLETIAILGFKIPSQGVWQVQEDREPGDLGFDPLGLKPSYNAREYRDKLDKELQNGRLAMLGIAGMVAQELVTGNKIGNLSKASADDGVLGLAAGVNIPELAKEVAEVLKNTMDV